MKNSQACTNFGITFNFVRLIINAWRSAVIYFLVKLGLAICFGLVVANTNDDTCRTFTDQL